MPFISSVMGTYGYGRMNNRVVIENYYTNSSGYYLLSITPSTSGTMSLTTGPLNNLSIIKSYASIPNSIHHRERNTNIYYNIVFTQSSSVIGGTTVYSFSMQVRTVTIGKGTTFTVSNLTNSTVVSDTNYQTLSNIISCYISSTINNNSLGGGFLTVGYFPMYLSTPRQPMFFISKLNTNYTFNSFVRVTPSQVQTNISAMEFIPKLYSGFNNNFLVFIASSTLASNGITNSYGSYVMNGYESLTNLNSNSYTPRTNGPPRCRGVFYYPPNKPIYINDVDDLDFNRVVFYSDITTGTSSDLDSSCYVWKIEDNGTSLIWTFLRKLGFNSQINGRYPYSLSSPAYTAIT